MIELRRIPLNEVPWAALDEYADRVIFQTREWIEFIAASQRATPVVAEVLQEGRVIGYFTGLTIRRWGIPILGSSFPGWSTPYIGFNLPPGFDRARALEALDRFAFHDLGVLHYEVSDRAFRREDGMILGLEEFPYESYQTDLTRSEDELFMAMESACRRCIRKADKAGVVIEEAHDIHFAADYHAQLVDVFAKQGRVPTYGVDRVKLLLRHMLPTGRLLALRAISPEGKCIATGIYVGSNDIAYFWGNASWRSEQHWRPNEALHWHAIRYWKARGIATFDWGGLGNYKKKYGVEPRLVPWFFRSRYRALARLRNEARRLFYRSRRLIGRVRRSRPAGAIVRASLSQPL
jgi:hypothetical protein